MSVGGVFRGFVLGGGHLAGRMKGRGDGQERAAKERVAGDDCSAENRGIIQRVSRMRAQSEGSIKVLKTFVLDLYAIPRQGGNVEKQGRQSKRRGKVAAIRRSLLLMEV